MKGNMESNNPKDIIGRTKPPIHLIPPVALIEEAVVFDLGSKKYGPYNWRLTNVSAEVYIAAALRHILSWQDGENIDPESGATHLAHARACLAIIIDAKSQGRLMDDRPIAGHAAEVIKAFTKTETPDVPGQMYFPDVAMSPKPEWRAGMENDLMDERHPDAYSYMEDDEVSKGHTSTVTLNNPGDVEYHDEVLSQPVEVDASTRWVRLGGQPFADDRIAYIERDGLTMTYWRHDGTVSSIYVDAANKFQPVIDEGYYIPYHGPLVKPQCETDYDACGCGVVIDAVWHTPLPVSCNAIKTLIAEEA